MPEFNEPQFSDDVLPDGRKRYDVCNRCNYDMHHCAGCGRPLSHNGLEQNRESGIWVKHEGCTD